MGKVRTPERSSEALRGHSRTSEGNWWKGAEGLSIDQNFRKGDRVEFLGDRWFPAGTGTIEKVYKGNSEASYLITWDDGREDHLKPNSRSRKWYRDGELRPEGHEGDWNPRDDFAKFLFELNADGTYELGGWMFEHEEVFTDVSSMFRGWVENGVMSMIAYDEGQRELTPENVQGIQSVMEYASQSRPIERIEIYFDDIEVSGTPEEVLGPNIKNSRSNMNWWKQADPRFEERPDGQYDLEMNPGDNPADWTPQNFRVGDEVIHLPTGQEAHIEETLDVDLFNVMLDSGDMVQAGPQDLQLNDNDGDGDTTMSPSDVHRFEGDDPEAQNFEDPTFSLTNDWLDDQVYQLQVGDYVHVYNPMDENGTYLGAEGEIRAVNSDTYTVDTDAGSGEFHRQEIELLEDANPHYRDNETLSWWKGAAPEVFPLDTDNPRPSAPKSPFKRDWSEIDESSPESAVPWYPDLPRYGPDDAKPSGRGKGKDHVGKPKIPGAPSVSKDELKRRGLGIPEMAENVYAAYKWANEEQLTRGMTWYDDAQSDATKALEDHPELVEQGLIDLQKMVGVFAVISPNLSWEKNTLYPSLIVRQYFKEGVTDPTKWREDDLATSGAGKGQRKKMAIMNSNRGKVIQIFNGTPVEEVITAPKTNNFYRNIAGQSDNVTVDVWAMRICMGELKPLSNVIDPWTGQRISYGGPSDNAYQIMHDAYVQATELIRDRDGTEISPRELQAVTWGVYRDLGVNAGVDLSAPPEEGLVPEEELAKMMGQEMQAVSKWMGASVNSVNEAMHSIVEAMGYLEDKDEEVVSHLRDALSKLEHASSLEQPDVEDSMYELQLHDHKNSWWKGASSLGETAEWLIEQVGAGVIPYEEAHQQIADMRLTLEDPKEVFELDSRLKYLEQMEKNPMPQQGVVPDLSYQQNPIQDQEDQPLPRAAWWDA